LPTASVLPYQAVFNDQVKIDDAKSTVATADLMAVDFLQKASSPTPPAAPAAVAPAPSPAIVQPAEIISQPPTTKPTNGPVTIYWTGKLLVTPLRGQPMMPISPGQSVVRLTGSPVKLTPQGSEVTAASATYRNPDGAVQLTHSATVPFIYLTQDKGLALTTSSIDYDPASSIAKLSGPSALAVPVNQKQMTVNWSRQGLLHVVRLPGQPNGVDHVDLIGDVAVSHPLFALNSRELQLDLDLRPKKGGTSTEADEQLRLLTAIDNVTCQLTHPDKPTEEIDGDRLVIRTEPTANKQGVLPREVVADGHVHAFDPDQSITAGHLDALLIAKAGPATQTSPEDVGNAVDLESLYASSDVHAKMKNDATAVADQLRVTTVDGRQKVDLWGPKGAKLDNGKGSWLTGPIVHLIPDRNGVSVKGPGSMETIRTASTTQPASAEPPRPIDISWTDSMSLDGSANIADVLGGVTVKNTDAVGTVSTITGDKAHLDLVDIPKNSKPSTTQPDEMAGKQLKMLTLAGHVVGSSKLKDPDGILVRQEDLISDKLVYNAIDATAIIPVPGKLFVENHKADAKEATSQGAMAIQWTRQLTYDQNTQKVTIDGDTRVGFEQDKKTNNPAAPMQLDSQQLIITLDKTDPAGPGGQGKMQLSQMQSIGQVHFVANGVELYCDEADYDPKKAIMTLTGNGRAVNAAGNASGSFDLLHFDTVKQEVIDGKNINGKIER
jgi:lipopolysaccharide export system protein LptA